MAASRKIAITKSGGKYPGYDYVVIPPDEGKVDKITGKGLSTNDYTTEDKNKLTNGTSGSLNSYFPSGW